MVDSNLLFALNPRQQEAVKHTEGPTLVLAGAGSGKTRVLTYRMAYILEKKRASPQQILAVTFTNKAANEMKHRVEELLKMPVQSLWIGTFHSISARILRAEAAYAGFSSNFTIYDVEDQLNQIKRIMNFLNLDKELLSPKIVQYTISKSKNNLQDARQYEKTTSDFRSKMIARVFYDYEIALRRNNAFDFDDLLIKPIEIFTSHRDILDKYQKKFKYILVDEYQDTNKAQYYWVKLLAAGHHNLCVVGDEDQSIYGWRGADIENILRFEQDFMNCKSIRLEQNYRSTQTILNAANAVVAHNVNRLGKNLWSKMADGESIVVLHNRDEVDEATKVVNAIQSEVSKNNVSLNNIVVLYRTNAQSRALEEQLRRSSIPYAIVGGIKFYERKEIKDILAYLRLILNPSDSVSLIRVINFPARGIGNVTLNAINQFAQINEITLYEAIKNIEKIKGIAPGYITRIKSFYQLIEKYRELKDKINVLNLVEELIKEIGLKSIYESSDLIEDQSRVENINELLNSLDIFISIHQGEDLLVNFLNEVALLTDIDRWDADRSSVTLMTLHSVKGLEFEVVFITGMEDGLLPHSRSLESPDDLEEERRLFYVGITRAQRKLFLSHAQTRHRFFDGDFGSVFRSTKSRFLNEIPEKYITIESFQEYFSQRYQTKSRFKRKSEFRIENLPDESSQFKIGQHVKHDLFGKGQILGVDFNKLGTKLTIQFTNKELKKIIAEYANLEKIDDME